MRNRPGLLDNYLFPLDKIKVERTKKGLDLSMKNIFILILLSFAPLAFSKSDVCPRKSWKISTMEFSPSDPYLVTVLGFSYGPEVKRFIPKLSGAISRFYYEGSQSNSKVTFFSTYYANEADAKEAYKHLSSRVIGADLQKVLQKGKQVVWFGGRGISKECLLQVYDLESKRL